MSCPGGALTLVEIMNWFFLFLYFYFSAVAYEHYMIGLSLPKLLLKEGARIEKEKKEKELEKQR